MQSPTDKTKQLVDTLVRCCDEPNTVRQALRAQKVFISSVSHDIRTPLNAIIGFLELLEGTPVDEEQRGFIDKSLSSSRHLLRLINDMLDLSKIEAGKLQVHKESFDYMRILSEVKSVVASQAADDVRLVVEGAPLLERYLIGDADRLAQLLINLLSNALKFTSFGFVALTTHIVQKSKAAIMLRICVEDTGIGMAKTKLKKIFEPFKQLENRHDQSGRAGTGLGLFICQNIVNLMGGRIWVESTVGKGSKFFMEIPFGLGTTIEAKNEHGGLSDPRWVGDFSYLKVLAAEDVEFNAELLKAILMRRFNIRKLDIVPDGQACIQRLRHEQFDIVFMDSQMPKMDGLKATKHIRTFDKHTPIIFMSANAFRQDITKALKAGANDYLTKPIRYEKLDACLQKYCSPHLFNTGDVQKEGDTVKLKETMVQHYKKYLKIDDEDANSLFAICQKSLLECSHRISEAIEKESFDALHIAVHSLKGIFADAGLPNMYDQSYVLMTMVQERKSFKQIRQAFLEIEKEIVDIAAQK